MSSYLGMDVQAVRALATQMTNAAGEIQQLTSQLTNQLQNTTWVGPDREHFVGEWSGTHVGQLNQVVNALHDAASRANSNAAEQEQASNSG